MTFTIRIKPAGADGWIDLRLAGRVARWRSEERANAYAERLSKSHPDWGVRVYGWLDAFSI